MGMGCWWRWEPTEARAPGGLGEPVRRRGGSRGEADAVGFGDVPEPGLNYDLLGLARPIRCLIG